MSTCPQCGTAYPAAVRICTRDGTVLETEQSADPRIGTVLDGKYRLDSRLGAGGMGSVYRAMHLMLGKTVAVKLIKPELVTSPDLVRRFQREARAASTLAHPNIAAAYDLGQTADGTLYIAMEFINGPSLKDVIRSEGAIRPGRIVLLLRQVGSALALAHRNDVIHRDLKPHNIALATDDGGHEVAKLLDFGIAKTFDETTQLTATGFALGTPQYMSPEQATGKVVDGRSDIYALGIILYEMLIGEVPFNDPSTPAVLVKHMTEAPEHPSHRRPDLGISPALEAVALKCLEKDPSARYQTVDEFLLALESTTAAHQVPPQAATLIVPAPVPFAAVGPDGLQPTVGVTAPTVVTPPPADGGAVAAGVATTRVAAAQPAVPKPPVRLEPAAPLPVPPSAHTTIAPSAKKPVAAVAASAPLPAQRPANPVPAPMPMVSAPLPPPPHSMAPEIHDKRGISPRTVAAAAVIVAVIGGGVLYGLVVLRAPREEASIAPLASATGPGASDAAQAPSSAANSSRQETAPLPATSGGGSALSAGASATAATPTGAALSIESTSRPSAGDAGGARPSQTASSASASPAAAAPAAPVRAANPTVVFRCSGATDVCPTVRSTVETVLRERGIVVSRDPARADIVVDARVSLAGEKTEQMFGQSFVVATYTTDLEAEAVKSRDAVSMIPPATVSFDSRYRAERLGDHARLIASGVADRISEYWKQLP